MTNTITITGRVAVEPELKFGKSGKAFLNLSVPDQKRTKDQAGQWQDASATTWFRATVFGDEAEYLAEHLTKGCTVTITGRLITREWTDNNNETRSSLEIDYAKVGIVQGAGQTQRSTTPPAGNPWATGTQPNGGAHNEPAAPF